MRISIPLISISWHGGVRVLVQAANYLAAQGHDVTILCSRGRAFSPYRISPIVRVRHIGVRTRWKQFDYAVFLAALPFVGQRKSKLIATFFVTYYSVRVAAALHRTGYIYFVQDIESKYSGGVRARLLNWLCNRTYGDRNIVTANPHLRERIFREFGRSCRSIQVGPGERFYTEPVRASKEYDVVYFLRGELWKGLDRFKAFVEAAGGTLKCLCVSQDERLFCKVSGPAVTCVKPADDGELIACLDSARVLLFTSYNEGFALPPLEAMARGLPAVLFRCGGPDLYIRDRINSFYVTEISEAVALIRSLVTDDDLYSRISREARSTADSFRLERALGQFSDFLTGPGGAGVEAETLSG